MTDAQTPALAHQYCTGRRRPENAKGTKNRQNGLNTATRLTSNVTVQAG